MALRRRMSRVVRGDHQLGELVTGSAATLGSRFIGIVAFVAIALVVTRWYGLDTFGRFNIGLAVVSLGAIVAKLGTDFAILKLHSGYADAGLWDENRALHRRALVIVLAAGATTSMVVWVAAGSIAEQIYGDPALRQVLRLAAVGIVLIAVMNIFVNSLRGFGSLLHYGWSKFAAVNCFALFLIVLTRSVGVNVNPFACYILALGAATLIAGDSVRRSFARVPRGEVRSGGPGYRALLRLSVPLMIAAAGYAFIEWTDSLLLGYFESAAGVGEYQVAYRLASVVGTPMVVINAAVASQLAVLHRRGDRDGMRDLARVATTLTLGVAVASAAVLGLFPDAFLGLFGVTGGAATLVILVLAQIMIAAMGPAGTVLTMSGGQVALQWIVCAGLVVNIGVNLLLIPHYGHLGAAITQVLTVIVLSGGAIVVVRRRHGFWVLPALRTLRTASKRLGATK